jgi:hypothetical protein
VLEDIDVVDPNSDYRARCVGIDGAGAPDAEAGRGPGFGQA